jgi:hypothetical protein
MVGALVAPSPLQLCLHICVFLQAGRLILNRQLHKLAKTLYTPSASFETKSNEGEK